MLEALELKLNDGLSNAKYNKDVDRIKKETFRKITELLKEDYSLLFPLLLATAVYSFNKQYDNLEPSVSEREHITYSNAETDKEEVCGKYLEEALTNNTIDFKRRFDKAFKRFIRNAYKDFTEAHKVFVKKFKEVVSIYGRKIYSIVRNEVKRVSELYRYKAAKLFAKKTKSVLYKKWVTVGDYRVRHRREASHVAMDGKVVLYDERFKLVPEGTTAIPKHSGIKVQDINCRCMAKYFRE